MINKLVQHILRSIDPEYKRFLVTKVTERRGPNEKVSTGEEVIMVLRHGVQGDNQHELS